MRSYTSARLRTHAVLLYHSIRRRKTNFKLCLWCLCVSPVVPPTLLCVGPTTFFLVWRYIWCSSGLLPRLVRTHPPLCALVHTPALANKKRPADVAEIMRMLGGVGP